MKYGVVVFPGSNCDFDAYRALEKITGGEVEYIWHQERDIESFDAVVLPGGFSYGDYLRAGAIARFSSILESIAGYAKKGKPLIGICNGFQVLTEAGLLPGALIRNESLKFSCKWVHIRAENTKCVFTTRYGEREVARLPIAHGAGCYFADKDTLAMLEESGRVVWRYSTPEGESEWQFRGGEAPPYNPNGSLNNIAGIMNEAGNVLGMMPHPERACETLTGGVDGAKVFESMVDARIHG